MMLKTQHLIDMKINQSNKLFIKHPIIKFPNHQLVHITEILLHLHLSEKQYNRLSKLNKMVLTMKPTINRQSKNNLTLNLIFHQQMYNFHQQFNYQQSLKNRTNHHLLLLLFLQVKPNNHKRNR